MSHPAPFAGFSGAYKLLSVTVGQDIHTTNGLRSWKMSGHIFRTTSVSRYAAHTLNFKDVSACILAFLCYSP